MSLGLSCDRCEWTPLISDPTSPAKALCNLASLNHEIHRYAMAETYKLLTDWQALLVLALCQIRPFDLKPIFHCDPKTFAFGQTPNAKFRGGNTKMLVSKNANIFVTPNANFKILVSPNTKIQHESVEYRFL